MNPIQDGPPQLGYNPTGFSGGPSGISSSNLSEPATNPSEGRGNLVPDVFITAFGSPWGGATGIVQFEIGHACRCRVVAHPNAHPQRGIVRKGGRDCGSSQWLPGEHIDLKNAAGDVLATWNGVAADQAERGQAMGSRVIRDTAAEVVIWLDIGAYQFQPSTDLPFTFSVTEIP